MAVSLPFKTGQVPPLAPRDRRWSVAVFTSREDIAGAVTTIEAVQAALDSHEAVIDILVNGNDDLARELTARYQAPHHLASPLSTLRIWRLPIHDKALTWNAFIHTIVPDADVVFFVDGYAGVAPIALTRLADRFHESPVPLAASAVPSVGRSASLMRARMLSEPQIYGSLYALRGDTVRALRHAAFRMPIGMYRVDGLLSSVVALNLSPPLAQWSYDRIAIAPDATWSRRPDALTSRGGVRTHLKRLVSQAFGVLEAQAFKEFLVVMKVPLASLPATDRQLVIAWMRRHPARAAATIARHPLALLRLAQLSRSHWASEDAAPQLVASTGGHPTPGSVERG
ncbi:MAG: hypothetical protein ABI634_16360 [Acidobacteriota bacterium]